MKTLLLIVLLLSIGIVSKSQESQEQKPINVLSMGFGKDFISGQPLINANFIIHNAYASYSLSIDNSVKSYDVGWTFNQKALKGFYLIPTLGVTVISKNDVSRYYIETVPNTNVSVSVDLDNGKNVVTEIKNTNGTIIGDIARENYQNKNHPNIGLFVGYHFTDGLTLFIKGTNNSLGAGMGFIIN